MTRHLVKLCVGVKSVDELRAFQKARAAARRAKGEAPLVFHMTRLMPKEKDALLDGGSLYWVIGGAIRVRQRLLSIEAVRDGKGIARCRLGLDSKLVLTRPTPRRAFQGWRYLAADDAPPDLPRGKAARDGLPGPLRAELMALGLL